MRTRHGITQVRGFKAVLRSAEFQSFLSEHPQAWRRWNVLRPILDSTLTIRQAAATFGVSERTIYRWKARYDRSNWYSLIGEPKQPKTTPRTKAPPWMFNRVTEIANDNLAWGAPKIADYIRLYDPVDRWIRGRTVSRLLARGLQQGDIVPRVRLKKLKKTRMDVRGRTINRITNSTDPASSPGERVHQDAVIAHIYDAGRSLLRKLVFSNSLDRYSRAGMIIAGEGAPDALLTKRSLASLQCLIGEPILEKISDNGSENLGEMIEYCEGETIVQLFTYPHAPKQNAVVERFNRTFQEECLLGRRIDLLQPIEVIQERINAWLVFYNTERPHEALGGIPPILALFRWKLSQLPPDRRSDETCCHMLWRGTLCERGGYSILKSMTINIPDTDLLEKEFNNVADKLKTLLAQPGTPLVCTDLQRSLDELKGAHDALLKRKKLSKQEEEEALKFIASVEARILGIKEGTKQDVQQRIEQARNALTLVLTTNNPDQLNQPITDLEDALTGATAAPPTRTWSQKLRITKSPEETARTVLKQAKERKQLLLEQKDAQNRLNASSTGVRDTLQNLHASFPQTRDDIRLAQSELRQQTVQLENDASRAKQLNVTPAQGYDEGAIDTLIKEAREMQQQLDRAGDRENIAEAKERQRTTLDDALQALQTTLKTPAPDINLLYAQRQALAQAVEKMGGGYDVAEVNSALVESQRRIDEQVRSKKRKP
jgi:putative transposase